MSRPPWAPAGIDLDRPSAARVYDYYLGGSHNFEVDRTMAEEAIRLWPDLPLLMQANREFLGRAVRFLADQGVHQFLDLGSGIPTVGNVHEIAHAADPQASVVYVDNDPVAAAHSRAILATADRTAVVEADLREPDAILGDPLVARLLDLDRPVALLLVAVLHFVPDTDGALDVVRQWRERLPAGSYLVVSHASSDGQQERASSHQQLYQRTTTPMKMRTHDEIAGFFTGFELVPPGLVAIPKWRPADGSQRLDDTRLAGYAGVGLKA